MPRTAQLDSPTKTRLLNAAQELMLTQGYAATTVDEICKAAKLTKGSFFHYFTDKEQLAQEVLQHFCRASGQMHRAFSGNDPDPLKRVYRYIDSMIAMAQDPAMKGCLLGLFSQELCESYPAIQKSCCAGFAEWAHHLGQELARAKARHAPKADFQPEELAEHLIAVAEGGMILGKAQADMSVVAKHLKHFKAYVQSLFKR